MDRNQKTFILVGLIGASLTGWLAGRAWVRASYALGQKQDLEQARKNSYRVNEIEKQVKSTNLPRKIIFYDVHPQLNDSTFRYEEREVSLYDYQKSGRWYFKHLVGGDFKFEKRKQPYTCDIRDCTIFTSVLKPHEKDVKIFENTTVQPLVKNIMYSFRTSALMTIYGTLCFDEESLGFKIYPKFIGQSFNQISEYLDTKFQTKLVESLLEGLLCLGISYFLIYLPLLNLYRRNKQKFKDIKAGEFSLFSKLPFFRSKNENNLKCIYCEANDSNIVFQCGHIEICQKCKEEKSKPEGVKCSICHKVSDKFLKIYVS